MSSINDIVKRLRENRILNEESDYSEEARNELIKLAKDGDQRAFDLLLSDHQGFIRNMTKKYFLDSGYDEEDIIQLGNIAFWDAVNSWDMSGNFEAYAGMIIKRRLIDEMNKMNAEKRKSDTEAQSLDTPIASDDEGGETALGDTIASKSGSAEEQYLGLAGAREIMKFLTDTLSESEREVIRMYIKGYKMSQIAEETGMKYKSAENALMRVKNKLADYLRARESKKINESSVEFTDEEKKILSLALDRIAVKESIDESTLTSIKESYENYTKEQIDKELSNIESEVKEIVAALKSSDYDDRDELLNDLHELNIKLSAMEDYIEEDQYEKFDDTHFLIYTAKDIEYEGDEDYEDNDPFRRVGMRQSDFVEER